jgi:hypothetical protein
MIINERPSTLTNSNHFLLLSVWHKVATLLISSNEGRLSLLKAISFCKNSHQPKIYREKSGGNVQSLYGIVFFVPRSAAYANWRNLRQV